MVRRAVGRFGLAKRIAINADQMLGLKKADKSEKWWFDFEEVDGILKTPANESS